MEHLTLEKRHQCKVHIFAYIGQGFPHQLPVLDNVILHPYVKRVACDDVAISRALILYKIAFILLGSGRKQEI